MNAFSSNFDLANAEPLELIPSANGAGETISRQMATLHEAANAVAALGRIMLEPQSELMLEFPAQIMALGEWRIEFTINQLADMSAFMQAGLTALLAITARKQDPTAAAQTLLSEYIDARAMLLAGTFTGNAA